MTKRAKAMWAYFLARLQEGSTWRGLALIAGVVGAKLEPAHTEAFIFAGLLISGIIGASFPDKK